MRSLTFRLLLSFILLAVPSVVLAHSVTVSGPTTFAALDGSADDHDGTANGVFTVSDGDLIVNGTINCSDDVSGNQSACAMAFNVSGNLTVNAGGALYAENRSGGGNGAAITITAGGNLVVSGILSTAGYGSGNSNAGNVTATAGGGVTIGAGATVDAGSSKANAGNITVSAGQVVTINGNVLSGPSRTIAATKLTGLILTGGSGIQRGGNITIKTTTFTEPALNVGSNAVIASQGEKDGAGNVSIEGCGVLVKGLVASVSSDNTTAKVSIRSGKNITIDARDLGVIGATLGRNGMLRADSLTDGADDKRINVFAKGSIDVLGPLPSASSLYAANANNGAKGSKEAGGTITVISTESTINTTGRAFTAGANIKDGRGGAISISSKGNTTLDGATIQAIGDLTKPKAKSSGGDISVRSYSGSISWTSGVGDVRPTGSDADVPTQGTIVLTACGTVNTTGSSFPTNGPPVGAFPTVTTGACSPAAPSLPAGEPVLLTCNTPPVANDASASTNEDTSATITLSGSDVDGDCLTFSIVTPPANGTLGTINQVNCTSATVAYSPSLHYNGPDSFVYQANDGNGGTDNANVSITVTAVNDPPTFQAGPSVTVLEDAGAQTYANWATSITAGPADESGQSVTFTVTNDNPSLFSTQPALAPNGTLTFTGAANVDGSATITIVAQDSGGTANGGNDTSAPQTSSITITPVNDEPSFTGGVNVTVAEDSGAYSATWATAINPGPNESGQTVTFNVMNSNNSLFSIQPAISSSGVLTFTTAANANGSAAVTVFAQDSGGTANGGDDTSPSQTFTITITSVNDAPSFTSGGNVTVLEDSGAYSQPWATGISPGPPDEAAQTVTFNVSNDNNSFFSTQPTITPSGVLAFVTAANAYGTANVTVTLTDNGGGADTSAPQTFTITLTPVNDAPSFTSGGNVTVNEDSAPYSAAWASSISPGANESGQTVSFGATNNNNALFSVQPAVSPSGVLTFTLAANANGAATVTVTLSDNGGTADGGVDTSAAQSFTITVNAVNDAPSFTGGGNVTVNEDSGAYSAAWATSISAGPGDESGQTLTFSVSNSNNALFVTQPAIDSTGNLTFTLAANAFGSASVTVTLSDNGGTANGGQDTSAPQTFTINIAAVNDAPSFTGGGNVTVNEDGAPYAAPWASGISAGPNESGQTLTFNVSNDNNSLFSVQPAVSPSGVLTFTLAANAIGVANVTVTLSDDGGTANGGVDTSAPQSFVITVNAVNDAPTFTGSGNVTVAEDSGAYSAQWTTSISMGPANESSQTGTFFVSNNNNSLFATQPSISPTGVLTFQPAANAFGSATVSVYLQDNGGTANGGSDTSATQTFTISVNTVNDPPSYTPGANVTVNEDSGAYAAAWATSISTGPPNEGQTPVFTATNDNNALFSAQPAISSTGVLTFTPAPNAFGTANVTVVLSDGVDSTAPHILVITVNSLNDGPIANGEAYETIGNTMLEVNASQTQTGAVVFVAGNLLANDSDPDGGPSPLTTSLQSVSPGATVIVNSNGTFTYLPPAGHPGATDSFQYSVSDGASSVVATVTITLKSRVWYVKNDAAAGGNGRSHDPFDTLVEAETASLINDIVFVFTGNGTSTGQNAGFTLKGGQRLLGAGVALTVPVSVNGGANPTVLLPAGTQPQIDNVTGHGVTINGVLVVEVAGLNIAGTADGVAAFGPSSSASIHDNTVRSAGVNGISSTVSGAATMKIETNVVTSAGNAIHVIGGTASSSMTLIGNTVKSLTSNGINIEGSLVTVLGFNGNTVHGDTAGTGIRAVMVTFDQVAGGTYQVVAGGVTTVGTSLNPVGTSGVVLANVQGSLSFSSLTVAAGNGPALQANSPVAFTGSAGLRVATSGGTLESAGGPASDANLVTFNMFLGTASSSASPSNGISLVDTAGTINVTSGAITGAVLRGVDVNGGSVNVTYGGSITATAQNAVRVTDHSGAASFTGAITATGPNAGISLATNTGSSSFSGGMTVSTTTGTAFNANSGGTISVAGTPNTLTTTTGTALNVVNTTIAASGITFRSISANGAASGIVLNTTGALGGLTVTGNGAAGTGGTIQNTTGNGISLTNTTSPSFDRIIVQSTARSGIAGTGVVNFTLTNSTVASSSSPANLHDANIDFQLTGVGPENNLSGVVTITDNTLTNASYHGIDIFNRAGTITNATITGNGITSSTVAANSLGSGIRFIAFGTAASVAKIMKADVNNNQITNFPSGVGLEVQCGQAAAGGPATQCGTAGSGTDVVRINGNTVKGASAANRIGAEGILALVNGSGSGNFEINTNNVQFTTGTILSHSALGNVTVTSVINGNVLTSSSIAGASGVGVGTNQTFGATDTPNMTVTISNNQISQVNGNGVLAVARSANGTLRARILSNAVAAPTSGFREGIRVDSGNAVGNNNVCLNISGNSSAGSGGATGIGLRKQGTNPAINVFGVNGMVATSTPAVQAYVNSLNPSGGGTTLLSATSGFTNCSLP